MGSLRHRSPAAVFATPRSLYPLLALLALGAIALLLPFAAQAASKPQVGAAWVTEVTAGSATFHAEIDPEGEGTTYRFEYISDAAYQANLTSGHDGFTGAARLPAGGSASAGSGEGFLIVSQHLSALKAGTAYHYRILATNGGGTATLEPALIFTTQELSGAFTLPDSRGWELVSPPEKNGGAIQGFERNHGGDVIQAAAAGPGAIAYTSASSFGGAEAQGAPQASQYVSRRGEGGWSTQNITTPTLSGAYGNDPNGVPYQIFSPDLTRALLLNGIHCRGEGTDCPVANPPLPGTAAPPGYQNYYLRDNGDGAYTALLTETNAELHLTASEFNLAFAGASPDLVHLVLSTCAALTPTATEVPGTAGCDPTKPNLYEWSGWALTLVNAGPGAKLAAQGGAVSEDGSRIYFTEEGKLWLRETGAVHELAAGAEFQAATPDGTLAFYTIEEHPGEDHLFRYSAQTETSESIATAVKGVLGASEDGSRVYYQDAAGLELWHSGTTAEVAPGAAAASPGDYPPTTGTARVSPDGTRLLFLSKASLTGYDNHDASTGKPDAEVYLYDAAGAATLTCVSCNPTGERPIGPSTIPGAISNGKAQAALPGQIVTDAYKPRDLSATANRVFFDSSDALAALDTNRASDVYQWEAQGTGTCRRIGGCLSLISSGTDSEGATFVDATESGEDAYFLTFSSLVPTDPGSADVYDARVGGGLPVPTPPIPCEADACQPLPSPPEDPTVGSLIPGSGNPPVHFPKVHHPKVHHHKKRQHKHKRGHR